MKMITLPRLARDKHRENSTNSMFFSGPGETLHVLKPQWRCGALSDGREFFYQSNGSAYFFPDVPPVFCEEKSAESNATTHPTPRTQDPAFIEGTNQVRNTTFCAIYI
jgi:hypothetical protein